MNKFLKVLSAASALFATIPAYAEELRMSLDARPLDGAKQTATFSIEEDLGSLHERDYVKTLLADVEQMILKNPTDSFLLADKAHLYQILGDYDNALTTADDAIKIKPSGFSFYRRAAIRLNLQDYTGALSDASKASKFFPDSLLVTYVKMMASREIGSTAEAKKEEDTLVRLFKSDYEQRATIGEMFRGFKPGRTYIMHGHRESLDEVGNWYYNLQVSEKEKFR